MRIHRRHLSRREAERLLDDPAAHGSALGRVLSAAGAPARPEELGGEDAAAAAFHRTGMVPSPGGGTVFVPAPRRSGRTAVRAVVATGAVVALTTGGFALAGSADLPRIPGLPGQASDRATESVAKDPKPSEASSTSATPGDEASETAGPGTSGTGAPGTPGSPTPTPNLAGLCRAYQTGEGDHGSSLDSTAFAALAAAAGGVTRVADYCVDLVGQPSPTGKPSVLPTPTSKPTPTSRPTDRPTGKPTVQPTSKPSVLPTPTSKPTPRPTPVAPTGSPTDKPTPTQPTGKPSTTPGKPTDQPSPTDQGGGSTS